MGSITRYEYAEMILHQLGIPNGWRHIGSKRGLMTWMGAESGWLLPCNGQPTQGANYNVLNTTLLLTGSTFYNTISPGVGVQNYATAGQGAVAVADTLLFTPFRGYEAIVAVLSKRFTPAFDVLTAVGHSDWGTFHVPGTTTFDSENARAILDTYQNDRRSFNKVMVGS